MKLYAYEPGCDEVAGLRDMIVSALARVEVPAALWRKVRIEELGAPDATILAEDFARDYAGGTDHPARFSSIAVSDPVLAGAAQRAGSDELRAYDAVQLASALAAREADSSCDVFACFDTALRRAAAASGFELIP